MAQAHSCKFPQFGLITRYDGARGPYYVVRVGKYTYSASSPKEAIIARRGLYQATILDGQYERSIGKMNQQVTVGAFLSEEALSRLGMALYLNSGDPLGHFWYTYNEMEYGPFKAPSDAIESFVAMLAQDVKDMEDAYKYGTLIDGNRVFNKCDECDGTMLCQTCGGVRCVTDYSPADLWYDCPECNGYGICSACKGYV